MTPLPAAAAHLAGVARLLRSAAFPVAPEQVVTFLAGVELLGPRSMNDISQAALATLAPDPSRRREFDSLFRAWFWDEAAILTAAGDDEDEDESRIKDDGGGRQADVLPTEQQTGGALSSADERLAARGFHSPGLELARFALALPGSLPTRHSFRSVRAAAGRPDLRKSLRAITQSDGDIPRPLLRRRQRVSRPLLLLIDISGSMKLHTEAHLRLAHAVVRNAGRVEVFTLGTRLTRITVPLRVADRDQALARVAQTVEDWDGGTRIGPTLLALLSVPRFAAFARGAAVVILSDGLERGGHVEMEQAFRRLKARAFRLSLLSPLAADPRYRPRTAALAAVLPYLDDLADGSGPGPLSEFILSLARVARPAREVWREAS